MYKLNFNEDSFDKPFRCMKAFNTGDKTVFPIMLPYKKCIKTVVLKSNAGVHLWNFYFKHFIFVVVLCVYVYNKIKKFLFISLNTFYICELFCAIFQKSIDLEIPFL